MKIGILSMQKIHNYGSFLQALALKQQFEKRGHDVYFIDIEPGRQIVTPSYEKSSILSKFDRYLLKRIENYFMSRSMAKIHISDYKKYLETDKALPSGERYDLAIIGSDEVFNATIPSSWGFSTQLFGNIPNARRIATYAASCGSTTYSAAVELDIVDELQSAMDNIEHISVRDENTRDFVINVTGKDAEIHVDPVFLGNYDDNIIPSPRKRPYLLVYAYANRISDEKEISAIKEYARINGLEIVSVGMQQRWCNNNICASAFELLGYIKGASAIVTDTFHGSVFSIKYNKRFVAIVRDSNKNKLGGLLKQFGLESRIASEPSLLPSILDTEIDYTTVNEYIAQQQNRSSKYLDIVLAEDK